ncbi:hypothetical protein GE300_16495 [Rhodobacteraceae bacterium 2CG4]|uniref:Uncharacterized protein n=1 Tax=Halovulum marinum TaxID=2662447 RepID=A0A6L5Z501_9RHOB|nr:hypothetical protein [Halovulum marinum]MSU91185.1 hypothetical protein [Halovulum marinum]
MSNIKIDTNNLYVTSAEQRREATMELLIVIVELDGAPGLRDLLDGIRNRDEGTYSEICAAADEREDWG